MTKRTTISGNGHTATALGDFADAPFNPRVMDDPARAGLEASIVAFGDLSGFVMNRHGGRVICGHQRRTVLAQVDLSAIAWGKPYTCEIGATNARFTSHERDGHVTVPSGSRFHVREVEWDEVFEKAANVAANSPHIAGRFTEGLAPILVELETDLPELSASLRLGELRADVMPDFAPVGEDEQGRLDEKAKVACPECGHEFTP